MPDNDIRGQLVSYLTDAVALEQNVEQMLGGMISTTADPTMKRRLERVATMAGDDETAAVARTNRAEEQDMARFIESHWDDVTTLSLREEGVLA